MQELTAVCLLGKSGFCLLPLEQSLIFNEIGFLKNVAVLFKAIILLGKIPNM